MTTFDSFSLDDRKLITLGILESCARVYDHAIVVSTHNAAILEVLRSSFGGSIEHGRHRWILRSRNRRLHLLSGWADRSPTREAELRSGVVRLLTGGVDLDDGTF